MPFVVQEYSSYGSRAAAPIMQFVPIFQLSQGSVMQIAVSLRPICVGFVLSTTLAPIAAAQKTSGAHVAERVGTALIVVSSGPQVTLDFDGNEDSSLPYDWVVLADSSLGLVFEGPTGARASGSPTNPEIKLDANIRALVPISAYEIRVVTFDVWRRHTGTLVYSRLQDMRAGEKKGVYRKWGGFAPSEARLQLTSIVYVSRVRYEDGRTVIADPTAVVRAAQVIKASITAQDLEPTSKGIDQTPSKS